MAQYLTKYGPAVRRVLANYPPGSPSLQYAIEAVVKTAMDRVQEASKDALAEQTCEQLHDGPAQGVMCKACYESLDHGRMQLKEDDDGNVMSPEQVSKNKEVSAIEKQVAMLIGGGDEPEDEE